MKIRLFTSFLILAACGGANLFGDFKTNSDALQIKVNDDGVYKSMIHISSDGIALGGSQAPASANLHVIGDMILESGNAQIHNLGHHGYLTEVFTESGNISTPIVFSESNTSDISLALPLHPTEGQIVKIRHLSDHTTTIVSPYIEGEANLILNPDLSSYAELIYYDSEWKIMNDLNLQRDLWHIDQLAYHFKLDESSGSTAFNSGVYDLDGTITSSNPVYEPSGKVDRAMTFDGSSSKIQTTTSSNIIMDEYTVCFWMKPSYIGSQVHPIISTRPNLVKNHYLAIKDGNLLIYYYGATQQQPWNKQNILGEAIFSNLTEATWHHIALTYNGSELTTYLNGDFGFKIVHDHLNSTNAPLSIGYDPKSNAYFKGSLDDIRIYNIALPEASIKAIYRLAN